MASVEPPADDTAFLRRAVEVSIRVGVVALLAFWCLLILRPFVQPIVWGVVIAVAAHPLHRRLERLLRGRSRLSAVLLVLGALLLLIVPTVALTASLLDTARVLAGELRQGALTVPPPPAFVADWPVVGDELYAFWENASRNLESALLQIAPQLKGLGLWLLSTGATTGVGIVKFVISIGIAGVLLMNASQAVGAARGIARRLAGPRGAALTDLAGATVQSVTRGILGVAVIQSLLAGMGMLAVGVPGAGLWALGVLLLAVIQLPTVLVLAPVVVYVFSTSSIPVAIVFTVWSAMVGTIDTFLKPLLMGRGVDVPMLVVFMGVIGGFMLDGIIGLFVGAVVLTLGYTLFTEWLREAKE
jgi:predicted PurR-regulated permease PerM